MQKSIAIRLGIFVIVGAFLVTSVAQASARSCAVTVTAPGSIQAAVDAASAGDTICLDGTFIGVPTVTVGTSKITIKSKTGAVLDGGTGPAFRLADGLSNVKIMDLEIKNRTGSRGGGVEAWDRTTSRITIRGNYFHDNEYSGVLVGSEGGFVHRYWKVRDNRVDDHGFVGIELTNCKRCSIKKNDIDGGVFGIVVQARNTITDGSLVNIEGARVSKNTISDTVIGMYVIAYEGQTGSPFNSVGASSRLGRISISNNTVGSSLEGIRFWAYNDGTGGSGGGSGGTAEKSRISGNSFTCTSGGTGIRVFASSGPANGDGTVASVKTKGNAFAGCGTDVINST